MVSFVYTPLLAVMAADADAHQFIFSFDLYPRKFKSLDDELAHFRQVVIKDSFVGAIESISRHVHSFGIDDPRTGETSVPVFYLCPSPGRASAIVITPNPPKEGDFSPDDVHPHVRRVLNYLMATEDEIRLTAGYYIGRVLDYEMDHDGTSVKVMLNKPDR
jgi:hypothetical protein